jgi:anaerobic ribonucleoside-triphosphate reductase
MGIWSFCRRCGWHSTGKFDACPRCGSKAVRHFDTDPLPNVKGSLFSSKAGKGSWPPQKTAKEKAKRG